MPSLARSVAQISRSIRLWKTSSAIGVLRIYSGLQRDFSSDDIYFSSAAANIGAIALENARLYSTLEKDYDTFRRDMLEWRAALGDEGMMGELVEPAEEPGIKIPPGG